MPQPPRGAAPGVARPAAATAAATGRAVAGGVPSPALAAAPAKKVGLRALNGPKLFISAAILALIGIGIYYLVGAIASSRADAQIAGIVERNDSGQPVALTRALAESLLDGSTRIGSTTNRAAIFNALSRATPSGDWDLDSLLVEAATRRAMAPEVRAEFLDNVIAPRATAAAVDPLIELANREAESDVGKAAIRATRKGANPRDFDKMLGIIVNRGSLREEAVAVAAAIAGAKRSDASSFSSRAISAYQLSRSPLVRQSLIRLLGHIGDPGAKGLITTALKTGDETTRLAAIAAMQNWPDESFFPVLVDAITTQEGSMVRSKAFDSAIGFLKVNRERSSNANLWPTLIPLADADRQKVDVITGLFNDSGSWRLKLLQSFTTGNHSDAVKTQAERAISKIPK